MSVNFSLAKIAHNIIEKVSSNQESKPEQPLFSESSKEASENELQSVELVNIITFQGVSKTEEELADYLEQLEDAVENPDKNSKETIETILLESDLNSSDILSIMANHTGKRDWLTKGIKKQFSGKKEEELLKALAHACAEMANSEDVGASGLAMNYIRTIDEINKLFKDVSTSKEDSNISTSTMIVGIRG